jgi:hypothetical protein
MRRNPHISVLLRTRGFVLHSVIGQVLKVNFFAQCLVVTGLSIASVLIGSLLDKTLILEGRNIGLLEHPAIWAFFGLQIALPLSIRYSLNKLGSSEARTPDPARPDPDFSKAVTNKLHTFFLLTNVNSRAIATICYFVGLVAFVWNTYQNQLPGIIVPYDFWDSSNHVWGYWITRVYKFYLFVWFLPYIALIHFAVLTVTLTLIRERRLSGELKLQPFHPDGLGGLGFVPGLVTTPVIVTLLFASIPTAGAFEVHRAFDITPLMGLTIILISTVLAYGIPILYLRTDLVALKRETVQKLRLLQQSYYSRITEHRDLEFETIRRANEALAYFEKICARVDSISNYPHLARLLKYLGLAVTTSVASFILKLYEILGPIIVPLLKRA